MWRMVCLGALAACASYRALPLDTPPPGPSPLALRYEQKRLHLFASTREDAQIEAVRFQGLSKLLDKVQADLGSRGQP